ncbi:MAG: hypothetical protein LBS18_04865 [Clostridiales bacterium]|jgi:hypothetical protein|nr:hypothetical protein [Clostridiales bacterium]
MEVIILIVAVISLVARILSISKEKAKKEEQRRKAREQAAMGRTQRARPQQSRAEDARFPDYAPPMWQERPAGRDRAVSPVQQTASARVTPAQRYGSAQRQTPARPRDPRFPDFITPDTARRAQPGGQPARAPGEGESASPARKTPVAASIATSLTQTQGRNETIIRGDQHDAAHTESSMSGAAYCPPAKHRAHALRPGETHGTRAQQPGMAAQALAGGMQNKNALVFGVIMQEILGKPKALRH